MQKRPRLVEEGAPINIANDKNYSSNQNFLHDEYQKSIKPVCAALNSTKYKEHTKSLSAGEYCYSSSLSTLSAAARKQKIGNDKYLPSGSSRMNYLATQIEIGKNEAKKENIRSGFIETQKNLYFPMKNNISKNGRVDSSEMNENNNNFMEEDQYQGHHRHALDRQNQVDDTDIVMENETDCCFENDWGKKKDTKHYPIRNAKINTHITIGGDCTSTNYSRSSEFHTRLHPQQHQSSQQTEMDRMQIDDIIPKPPLIVLDGANIAYAYSKATNSSSHKSSLHSSCQRKKLEPNPYGIKVAVEYFESVGCRIQVVLPSSWEHSKFRSILETQKSQILQQLIEKKMLCFAPSTDDDDAYMLAIAKREDTRGKMRRLDIKGHEITKHTLESLDRAFLISNDMFRDAMERNGTGLKDWLYGDSCDKNMQQSACMKTFMSNENAQYRHDHLPPNSAAGRISFSFGSVGSINEFGDKVLDFMPNPRHGLVDCIEKMNEEQIQGRLN